MRKGNKITIFAIIIIIMMGFYAKLNMPMSNIGKYANKITYLDHEYVYTETIKASPLRFIKGERGSDEGFRVLIMRKDKRSEVPEEVYIYIGNREYLKYIISY